MVKIDNTFSSISNKYNAETAPVILWLNGGPGTSSMFGLFVENGPFMLSEKGYLEYRAQTWTMTHSIIYIDSPVGTGKFQRTLSENQNSSIVIPN